MTQPAKKTKRRTKYSADYQKEYPFIHKCSSSINDYLYKFHCTSCNINVSCAHGGIKDVKDHISTNNHKSAHSNREISLFSIFYHKYWIILCTWTQKLVLIIIYSGNLRVDEIFRKQPTHNDKIDPTIAAETKMVMLLVQHNTFLNTLITFVH